MPGPESRFGFGRIFNLSPHKDQGAKRPIPVTGGTDLDQKAIRSKLRSTRAGEITKEGDGPAEQNQAVKNALRALLRDLNRIDRDL